MAEQTLEQVLEAEKQAQAVKAEVIAKVKKLRADFQEENKALTEKVHTDVEAYRQKIAEQVTADFKAYQATAKAAKDKEIAAMKAQFEAEEAAIVSYVVEEVTKLYGNR